MTNDVAVFLDLDNFVIGAQQANLGFDIALVLEHIKTFTGGRIVLRQAYGAVRQSRELMHDLAEAGFVVQSTTRINNFGKNLADMQIVVNAMDTLVDGHRYNTYVLMSGDRDFTPLVQSLRKRGKQVIGVGLRRATSTSLAELCDSYIYYEDLLARSTMEPEEIERLLIAARDSILKKKKRAQASILNQRMMELSDGRFDQSSYPEGSFRRFLEQYPHLVQLEKEGSTVYVRRPALAGQEQSLHAHYFRALKKKRLRVIPAPERLRVLKALIALLTAAQEGGALTWRQATNAIAARLKTETEAKASKNAINAVLLVAREAGVIRTLKGESLATAPIILALEGQQRFQQAVVACDRVYLRCILDLPEPFVVEEAALALYDSLDFVPYIQYLLRTLANTQEG